MKFKNLLIPSFFIVLLFLILLSDSVFSDAVIMKNKRTYTGLIVKQTEKFVTLKSKGVEFNIPLNEVQKIEKWSEAENNVYEGDFSLESGDISKALEFYQKAQALEPDNQNIKKKIEEINAKTYYDDFKKAVTLIQSGEKETAIKILNDLKDSAPIETVKNDAKKALAEIYFQNAIAYKDKVDISGAEREILKTLELQPEDYDARIYLANLNVSKQTSAGREEAIKQFTEALKYVSDDKLKAQTYFQIANLYSESNNIVESLKYLEKVLEMESELTTKAGLKALNYYIALADDIRDETSAEKKNYLEKAYKIKPDSPEVNLRLGKLYFSMKDYNNALRHFQNVLNVKSDDSLATYFLGVCYKNLNLSKEAKDTLDKAIVMDPNNYDALCEYSELLVKEGLNDEALNKIEKAIEIDPDKFKAHFLGAVVYNRKRKFIDARDHLEKALKINPDDVDALILLGDIYVNEKKPAEAEVQYEKALKLDDENAKIHNKYGEIKLIRDLPSRALEEFEKAVELDKNFYMAYLNQGEALIRLEKYDEALKRYEIAMGIDPNKPEVYQKLGILYQKYLRDYQKAYDNYQKYLALGGPEIDKVNEWIKECLTEASKTSTEAPNPTESKTPLTTPSDITTEAKTPSTP